jgi:hypothetical protein
VLLRDLSVDSQLELVAQFAQRRANVAFVVLCSVCKRHTLLDEVDLEEVGKMRMEGKGMEAQFQICKLDLHHENFCSYIY